MKFLLDVQEKVVWLAKQKCRLNRAKGIFLVIKINFKSMFQELIIQITQKCLFIEMDYQTEW